MPVSLEGIPLPEDIAWTDEVSGYGVGQSQEPTLRGALVIEEIPQPNGRPISLSTGNDVWVERQVVEQLHALASTPLEDDGFLTLEWGDGREFKVAFDRSNGSPIQAAQIRRLAASAELPTHPYSLTISLLEKE